MMHMMNETCGPLMMAVMGLSWLLGLALVVSLIVLVWAAIGRLRRNSVLAVRPVKAPNGALDRSESPLSSFVLILTGLHARPIISSSGARRDGTGSGFEVIGGGARLCHRGTSGAPAPPAVPQAHRFRRRRTVCSLTTSVGLSRMGQVWREMQNHVCSHCLHDAPAMEVANHRLDDRQEMLLHGLSVVHQIALSQSRRERRRSRSSRRCEARCTGASFSTSRADTSEAR